MFYSLYYQQESRVGYKLASDAKHSIPSDVMSDLSELTGLLEGSMKTVGALCEPYNCIWLLFYDKKWSESSELTTMVVVGIWPTHILDD